MITPAQIVTFFQNAHIEAATALLDVVTETVGARNGRNGRGDAVPKVRRRRRTKAEMDAARAEAQGRADARIAPKRRKRNEAPEEASAPAAE